MKKSDVLEILKTGFILFTITAIAAGSLAAINGLTAPVIAENTERKRNIAMSNVMPGVTSFERIDYNLDDAYVSDSSVKEIYCGGENKYVVLCEPIGYGGPISLVVGVETKDDGDVMVTGVDITSQSETAGLGSNCTKDEFKNQFIGKSYVNVVKQGAEYNEIDAISSATITSKAVTKGVNDALNTVQSVNRGGGMYEE